MKDGKTYIIVYQAIRQTMTNNVPIGIESPSKSYRIRMQNISFYNVICALLEIEPKSAKQQLRKKNDETQEKQKPKRSDYKNFQAA